MRRGTVVSLKRLNLVLVFLKNNWCLLLLSLCLIIGLSLGAFLCSENGKLHILANELLQEYLAVRTDGSFFAIFISSLLLSGIFLVLVFALGTSVTGITVVPIFTIFRGIIVGMPVSLLYSQYALNGIAFNALVLIPPTIVSVTTLIFAAREAVSFSLQVIQLTLPDKMPKNLSYAFNYYCKRYLIYLFFTIISAALDGWISINLISYFNL